MFAKEFLSELFHLILTDEEVLRICDRELGPEYFQEATYLELYSTITDYYKINKASPTYGVLKQILVKNKSASTLCDDIFNTKSPDKSNLLRQLREFIKERMLVTFYEEFRLKFNQDSNKDNALRFLKKTAKDLENYSIYKQADLTSLSEKADGDLSSQVAK